MSSLRLNMISPFHSRPQRSKPTVDTKEISRRILVNGAEHVLSHGGTSQYNSDGAGASACGLASLNFARIVFSIEQSGLYDMDLLQAVLARECAEETTAICALWSGNRHLDVEDICSIPLFEKTLKLKTTTYGLPGVSEFKTLLTEMSNLDSSAVVIITRPPEIIACLKLRLKPRNVFIIFDSHPRPSYPNGAGMLISPSIEGTARRLTELLPTVDLADSFLQWQAQLLANYSGHVFVPHAVETSTTTLWQAVLESSLAQLSMQAEISELRSQTELLKGEQQRLESELMGAEARSRDRERLIRELQQQAQQRQQQQQRQWQLGRSSGSPKLSDHSFAPPRQFSSSTLHSSTPSSSKESTSTSNVFRANSRSVGSSSGRELGHLDKPPTPPSESDDSILAAMRLQKEFDKEDQALSAQRTELAKATFNSFRPDSRSVGSNSGRALGHFNKPPTPPSKDDDSILAAMRLQKEFDKEDHSLSAQRGKLAKTTFNSFRPDSRSVASSSRRTLGHLSKPPTPPSKNDDGILAAMRLQNEFNKEDRALSAQRAELAKSTQKLFVCGICLEEMPEDSIARPDPCQHTFCRECLRGHVAARLNEHRFPILCPSCSVSKGKGKAVAGEVSQSLALDLGLTDEQFSVWSEMEMVGFCVPVYCRKCRRTMFVAKDEHEEANIIPCPLPDCNHVWCKQCQQSIDIDGPKHSCDGTSELAHLVKQEGWKYCPTCKTPIQKTEGCNHMTCITPACNTHFCYICGGLIVKSAVGQEVTEATSAHFNKNCTLFEVPE